MTFFVNPSILENYLKGIIRTSVAAHMEVARHYQISTCNFAKEIADQITVGTLSWEAIRGTHPNDYGNAICANMISDMLEEAWSTKKGAGLSLEFSGTAVGVYMLAGPDAGTVEVRIDGGPFVTYDLYHKKFSKNLHYPQTILFSNDLEEGTHLLELHLLGERSGTGNALRIMDFVVN